MQTTAKIFDVLVIGSGAAGLGLALSLTEDINIAVLSKGELSQGSSPRAQGGIAAVMDTEDNFESHVQDTCKAGAGLCDEETVRFVVENGKNAIHWLIDQGVEFTKSGNHYHLNKEGGHSHRRILHVADKTGAAVIRSLSEQIKDRENITCLTQHTVIDLIVENNRCLGALVFDNTIQKTRPLLAKVVVLATGGTNYAYLHCTSPEHSTGDGIAMAYRASCQIANLEFMQFHPTLFFQEKSPPFLITEAIRGEGGKLVNADGQSFMHKYHASANLGPRDVVTRAIRTEMQVNNANCVYLDIRQKAKEKIIKSFPTIYAHCLKYQIDITQQLIPVTPAAHYTCGGVVTNRQGKTNIENLYAVGEVAHTGLHGANRMGSNSLLECLVFAASASKSIQAQLNSLQITSPKQITIPISTNEATITHSQKCIAELRQIMWDKVGIVRNNHDLHSAYQRISAIHQEITKSFQPSQTDQTHIELYQLSLVCQLITRSALQRKESRGSHYNTDYPQTNHLAKNTIIKKY